MSLTAPTTIVFLVALVIAVLAVLAVTNILVILPFSAFWLMTGSYVILALACLLRGL